MRRAAGGPARLAALAALVVLVWAECARGDDCTRLVERFKKEAGGGLGRAVTVHGAPRGLQVRAAGPGGRALGALLAAVLRHNGYSAVRIAPHQPNTNNTNWTDVTVSAGRAFLERARLQARPGQGCAPAAARWPPAASVAPDPACAFLSVADLPPDWKGHLKNSDDDEDECARCTVLVAPARLARKASELTQRAKCSGWPLRILPAEPLRTFITSLNRSLLFFDRPLEIYDSYVQMQPEPPQCNTDTRSPRDELMSKFDIDVPIGMFAPHVTRVVDGFAPSSADIREVLAFDMRNGGDIEKYACGWALRNLQGTDRASEDRVDLTIRLLLCKDDPDRGEYENMGKDIFGDSSSVKVTTRRPTTVATVAIEYKTVDCERGDVIGDELLLSKHESSEQHVFGWMAASASPGAALQAQRIARPLLAYGAPPAGLRPNVAVRALAGSTRLLALAYLHLLNECGVRRLAVLTEQTAFAEELMGFIRDSSIIIRQRNITSTESIDDALREFREADARVYFVNANASVSAAVICAAQRTGMAAGEDFVWLVREWRAAGRCGSGDLQPLALGVAWRGAAGAEWWLAGEGRAAAADDAHEALEARWSGRAWPPLAAPILDGLRLLNRTVVDFIGSRPDSVYDRFVFGNTRNFDTAISAAELRGISQEVIYNKSTYEVSSALVFVERWRGSRRQLAAVWRASAAGVLPLARAPGAPGRPWCARATAGPRCLTTRSGDAFAPKCHDSVWWICLTLAVLAPVALAYARRARLRRLKLRDLALCEQLQEQRKNHSSKFSSSLVSRNQFELREELGFGAYGRVRAAVLRRAGSPARAVAAKEPAFERLQDEAELIREASVLARLNHENIIRFEGVCLDGRAVFFMEYAFFGDLRHYLRARRPLAESVGTKGETGGACEGRGEGPPETAEATEAAHVSAAALTRLARQAAAALLYLESRRIVHRDIRAANCLVDEARNLKLADFGLARHLAEEEEEYIWQNLRRLPAACMAPESLVSGVFSAASDVWALGVLMLELVTLGEPPYGARSTVDIVAGLRAGDHPPLPVAVTPDTRRLLEWCWQRCPGKRPGAAQVRLALRQHAAALAPVLVTFIN